MNGRAVFFTSLEKSISKELITNPCGKHSLLATCQVTAHQDIPRFASETTTHLFAKERITSGDVNNTSMLHPSRSSHPAYSGSYSSVRTYELHPSLYLAPPMSALDPLGYQPPHATIDAH